MSETITGKLEIEVNTDNIHLQTNNAHDTLTISGLSLTADEAASLAWLLNGETTVTVIVEKL
jgi:hypothetical protein